MIPPVVDSIVPTRSPFLDTLFNVSLSHAIIRFDHAEWLRLYRPFIKHRTHRKPIKFLFYSKDSHFIASSHEWVCSDDGCWFAENKWSIWLSGEISSNATVWSYKIHFTEHRSLKLFTTEMYYMKAGKNCEIERKLWSKRSDEAMHENLTTLWHWSWQLAFNGNTMKKC